jgi:hypothetical protein
LFRSNLPQMRVFVHVANDLSAKQPHIGVGFGWFFSTGRTR